MQADCRPETCRHMGVIRMLKGVADGGHWMCTFILKRLDNCVFEVQRFSGGTMAALVTA